MKKLIIFFILFLINTSYAQEINRVFKNKSLQKEVEFIISYLDKSLQMETDLLTKLNISDSLSIDKERKPFIIFINNSYQVNGHNELYKDKITFYIPTNNEETINLMGITFKDDELIMPKHDAEEIKVFGEKRLQGGFIQIKPYVFLIFDYMDDEMVDFGYINDYNQNKFYKKEDLLNNPYANIECKQSIIRYNVLNSNLFLESFSTKDNITFIGLRFNNVRCDNCDCLEERVVP